MLVCLFGERLRELHSTNSKNLVINTMAATVARAHRTFKELTELHAGARPLDFVRRKRDRADDGQAAAGSGKTGKKGASGGAHANAANALRAVHISLGEVAQAAGSAYIEVGKAKLLCTVHGPRPDARAAHFSEQGRLVCQVKFAAFSGVPEDEVERCSRELPLVIHPALEAAVQLSRFPKSLLEVHVLVLEQDGDMCSPAITGKKRWESFALLAVACCLVGCMWPVFLGLPYSLCLVPWFLLPTLTLEHTCSSRIAHINECVHAYGYRRIARTRRRRH